MNPLHLLKDTVHHILQVLILQGVAFIGLSLLIFVYPEFLAFLVAAMLLILGSALLIMAYKVNRFWQKVPKFLK